MMKNYEEELQQIKQEVAELIQEERGLRSKLDMVRSRIKELEKRRALLEKEQAEVAALRKDSRAFGSDVAQGSVINDEYSKIQFANDLYIQITNYIGEEPERRFNQNHLSVLFKLPRDKTRDPFFTVGQVGKRKKPRIRYWTIEKGKFIEKIHEIKRKDTLKILFSKLIPYLDRWVAKHGKRIPKNDPKNPFPKPTGGAIILPEATVVQPIEKAPKDSENSVFRIPTVTKDGNLTLSPSIAGKLKGRDVFISPTKIEIIRAKSCPIIRWVTSFDDLGTESILHQCGYNVDRNNGLSSKQRHEILYWAIVRKHVTRNEALNHISWLINTREGRPYMDNAIDKWKEDLAYVRSLPRM